MGHLHYTVRDIAANRDFWVRLGGTAIAVRSPGDAVKFADVLVLLTEGDYAGAKAMIEKLAVNRPPTQAVLDKLKDVPVDIEPRYVTAEQPEASN